MDTNIAAWMIGGGPRAETLAERREREQLQAYRANQRLVAAGRPSLIDRIRTLVRPTTADADVACCPA